MINTPTNDEILLMSDEKKSYFLKRIAVLRQRELIKLIKKTDDNEWFHRCNTLKMQIELALFLILEQEQKEEFMRQMHRAIAIGFSFSNHTNFFPSNNWFWDICLPFAKWCEKQNSKEFWEIIFTFAKQKEVEIAALKNQKIEFKEPPK